MNAAHMLPALQTITFGNTNCYLAVVDGGFVLVDTGYPFDRARLEAALAHAGCAPGKLRLILATHGDIDHTGNCAYLREKYRAPIAMHPGDTAMCLKDGVTRDRGKVPPDFPRFLFLYFIQSGLRYLLRQMVWGRPYERFTSDRLLADGQSLAEYGWEATVLYTPGHSQGSISVLTPGGDLICGDLFGNVWGKQIKATDQAGLNRLRALDIKTIYPGHGRPFPMAWVWQAQS
jgi:hydroxyacylglutathione hydrolase